MNKTINTQDPIQDQIDELIFKIMKRRKKLNITQTELASMSGVPQPTIARIESFSNQPNLKTLVRLGTAMGMRIDFECI